MTELTAKPLTHEAFAPYGQVLAAKTDAVERQPYAGKVMNTRSDAVSNLTYMRAVVKPPVIGVMEQHPHSSQLFVPMNGARYMVGVCPPNAEGGPDIENLEAFIAEGGQAVTYDAGAWHSPLCNLDTPGEYVMQRWDDEGPEDTILVHLETPVTVILP